MQSIKEFIDRSHNPNLVQPDVSPNGNTIYHIYSDGTITYQKGGWAYRDRSEFTSSCAYLKKKYYDLFPITCDNRISFAIVTSDDALTIQNMMKEFDKV